MDLELRRKVVLVTGGCSGIGAAIVARFLAEGARLVVVDRDAETARRHAAAAEAAGHALTFVAGELADERTCQRAVAAAEQQFGALDVVVHNAGRNDGVGLDAGVDAFVDSLRDNLVPAYALMHHGLPLLRESRGNIVAIGSKVAVTGQGGTSGYAAAKGALLALVREWAVELAPHGIRANAVVPAEVWTPMYERWLLAQPDPAGQRAAIERMVPLAGRFTTADEIADTVAFVASPRSSHTTGQFLFVDGGYTHLDRRATPPGPTS